MVEILKKCFRNLETCSFYPIEEKANQAFVLMPFDEVFNEVYHDGIKRSLEEIGWECDRSDERWDTPEVVCTICKSIQEACLVIADVTGKNTNVFLELGLSFGLEKNILLVTQDFTDLPFDVRTFRAIEYTPDNLEEFQLSLQDAIGQLRPVSRMSEEAIVFQENVERYKTGLTDYNKPMMQVFIGSMNSRELWLEASEENRLILSCAPEFLHIRNSIARENIYEFKTILGDYSLRIFPNGFIVSHFSCLEWPQEKNVATIHELMYYIFQMFFFAIRIMKHKNFRQPQRIRIELYKLEGYPVRYDLGPRGRLWGPYHFIESPVILIEDFNPSSSWANLFTVLMKFYRKTCSHLGIQNIKEETIRNNICELLNDSILMRELYTFYQTPRLLRVPINEMCGE